MLVENSKNYKILKKSNENELLTKLKRRIWGKYSEYSQEILQELSNKYTNCTFDFQLVELNVCISVFCFFPKFFSTRGK